MKEFRGKEELIENWNKVIIAIVKAQSGESNIKYLRQNDKVIGVTAEILLQFGEALQESQLKKYDEILAAAKEEVDSLLLKKGEVTSKQRVLIDSILMRNAIVKAETGELKINMHRNEAVGGLIVGISADLIVKFAEPLDMVDLEGK